jgi:hypothetical protein
VSAIIVFSYSISYTISDIRIPYILALVLSIGLFVPRCRQLLNKNKNI